MKNNILAIFGITLIGICASPTAIAENGCRTGGKVLANAVIRSYAEYAFFYGDLKSYISNNKGHFILQGDSIKCAKSLASALMNQAVIHYDKAALQRKRELDSQLGKFTSGTPSQLFQATSQQINNLIPVFTKIASGGYREPTPAYDTMLASYKMAPMVIIPKKSIIEEKAEIDARLMISMTNSIAD